MGGINHITFSQIQNVASVKGFNNSSLALNGPNEAAGLMVGGVATRTPDENKAVRKAVLEGLTNRKYLGETKSVTASFCGPKLVLGAAELQKAAIENKKWLKRFLLTEKIPDTKSNEVSVSKMALTVDDVRVLMKLIQDRAYETKAKMLSNPAKMIKKPVGKKSSPVNPTANGKKTPAKTGKSLGDRNISSQKSPVNKANVKVPIPPAKKTAHVVSLYKRPDLPTKGKKR